MSTKARSSSARRSGQSFWPKHWSDWIIEPLDALAHAPEAFWEIAKVVGKWADETVAGIWSAGERALKAIGKHLTAFANAAEQAVGNLFRSLLKADRKAAKRVRRSVSRVARTAKRAVRKAKGRKRSSARRRGGATRRSGGGWPRGRGRGSNGSQRRRRPRPSRAGMSGCLEFVKAPAKKATKPRRRTVTTGTRPAPVKTSKPSTTGTTRTAPSAVEGAKTTPMRSGGAPTMSINEHLDEAPQTDADHLEKLRAIAEQIEEDARAVEEYVGQCDSMGFDESTMEGGKRLAEHLAEAARAVVDWAQDFESTYEGIRQTAASGVKIPGQNGEAEFWTGQDGGR
jgi:hypothetical protein